jgi:Skp family chaperone for outer membrane proteins
MNFNRLIAAAFALTVGMLPAIAQTPKPPSAAAPAATAATGIDAKIVVIDTSEFEDPKGGISKLVAARKLVDNEFTPRRTELQGMQQRYQTLVDKISKTTAVADPKAQQAEVDQADALKRELERKAQDASIAYEKRVREAVGPIYEDINRSLEAFAKSRGIALVLDFNKLAGAVLITNDSMDITRAFIAEYNSKNPGTASAATPAGR